MRITKSVVFDVNKCGGRFYVGWDNFDLLTWLCSGHYNGRSSPQETGWSSLGIHVSSCPLFKGPRTVGSENRTIPLSVQS